MISLIVLILTLITEIKVFEKYGEPGWHGIIPVYSQYREFSILWTGEMGIVYIVSGMLAGSLDGSSSLIMTALAGICALVYLIVGCMYASRKSRAFGGGILLTLVILFFPFIGNLYIAFSDRRYYPTYY